MKESNAKSANSFSNFHGINSTVNLKNLLLIKFVTRHGPDIMYVLTD